jgi:hypothetical protein
MRGRELHLQELQQTEQTPASNLCPQQQQNLKVAGASVLQSQSPYDQALLWWGWHWPAHVHAEQQIVKYHDLCPGVKPDVPKQSWLPEWQLANARCVSLSPRTSDAIGEALEEERRAMHQPPQLMVILPLVQVQVQEQEQEQE